MDVGRSLVTAGFSPVGVHHERTFIPSTQTTMKSIVVVALVAFAASAGEL